ncbi:MAG: putative metalloprotease CJM1_0395 family protein [Spirochaetia bacterium]
MTVKAINPLQHLNQTIEENAARSLAEARVRNRRVRVQKQRDTGRYHAVDSRVRNHENIHASILGSAGGPVMYRYSRGPDGRMYAAGGSVKVDLSPVPGDHEATVRKARKIRLAAMGPQSPSGADIRVAAKAYRMEMAAKRELRQEENPLSRYA